MQKKRSSYFSPAKVNLFFRVLSKRPDGFHEIASIYQAIDLGDFLLFKAHDHDALTIDQPAVPADHTNLICKARDLFREKTGLDFHVQIDVKKQIPTLAGLGGGSSNAATTLFALNEMCGEPLSISELSALGATLGSDVSFFFSSGFAYCTGRGEIFQDIDAPSSFEADLYKPDFGLSTPLVYRNTNPEVLLKRDPAKIVESYKRKKPVYFNDLEVAALEIEPRLKTIKERLEREYQHVTMTGSGTAFFCIGGRGRKAKKVRNITRRDSWYSL